MLPLGCAHSPGLQAHAHPVTDHTAPRPLFPRLQAELCDSGALRQLYNLAVQRQPIAFEALRLLAYRNRIGVQQMVNLGAIELLEQVRALRRCKCAEIVGC